MNSGQEAGKSVVGLVDFSRALDEYSGLSDTERKDRVEKIVNSLEGMTGKRATACIISDSTGIERIARENGEDDDVIEYMVETMADESPFMYSSKTRKIYIFVPKMRSDWEVVAGLLHETGHDILNGSPLKEACLGKFAEEVEKLHPKISAAIRKAYQECFDEIEPEASQDIKERAIREEIVVEVLARRIGKGKVEGLMELLTNDSKNVLRNYLNVIGYEEADTRGQVINGGERNDGA